MSTLIKMYCSVYNKYRKSKKTKIETKVFLLFTINVVIIIKKYIYLKKKHQLISQKFLIQLIM